MFDLSIFSLTGIGVVALMIVMVVLLYRHFDPRLMKRMMRVGIYFLLGICIAGCYMWVVQKSNTLWTSVLFLCVISLAVSSLLLRKNHLWRKSFAAPVMASTFVGMTIVSGVSVLLFSSFTPLITVGCMAIEASVILNCVSPALGTYIRSLRNTQEHYQYLLANGATHFEALLPCIRRSLRGFILPVLHWMTTPIVVAPPMLFCGMVLVGYNPLQAAVIMLITTCLFISASLLILVILLYLFDHIIFDRSGRFLL